VLLAGPQTVFTAEALCSAQPVKAKCACPHCEKKMSCCVARSAPASNPLSVPPASNTSQNQLHLLAAAVSQLITLPVPAAPESAPSPSFVLKAADLPLFARNCSYLL